MKKRGYPLGSYKCLTNSLRVHHQLLLQMTEWSGYQYICRGQFVVISQNPQVYCTDHMDRPDLLLPSLGYIAIRRVCLFVCLFVGWFVRSLTSSQRLTGWQVAGRWAGDRQGCERAGLRPLTTNDVEGWPVQKISSPRCNISQVNK